MMCRGITKPGALARASATILILINHELQLFCTTSILQRMRLWIYWYQSVLSRNFANHARRVVAE